MRILNESVEEVRTAALSDGWKTKFPGKAIIERFAKELDLGKPIVLQNSLIKELAGAPSLVPTDLASVIRTILALSNT